MNFKITIRWSTFVDFELLQYVKTYKTIGIFEKINFSDDTNQAYGRVTAVDIIIFINIAIFIITKYPLINIQIIIFIINNGKMFEYWPAKIRVPHAVRRLYFFYDFCSHLKFISDNNSNKLFCKYIF